MTDVLPRIAASDPVDTAALEALLPDRWVAAHTEHRLERREEESREAHARRRRKRSARRILTEPLLMVFARGGGATSAGWRAAIQHADDVTSATWRKTLGWARHLAEAGLKQGGPQSAGGIDFIVRRLLSRPLRPHQEDIVSASFERRSLFQRRVKHRATSYPTMPKGFVVFQRSRVKSGTSIDWLRLAIERSLSGPITDQAAAS